MGLINKNNDVLTKITGDFLLHIATDVFSEFSLCPTEQDTLTLYGLSKHLIGMIYDDEVSDAVINDLTGRDDYNQTYREQFNCQLIKKCEMFNYFSKSIIQEYGPGCIDSILKVFAAVVVRDTTLPDNSEKCFNEVYVAVTMFQDGLLKKKQVDYKQCTKTFFEEMEKESMQLNNENEIRYCGNCGAKIVKYAEFCGQCGKKITKG